MKNYDERFALFLTETVLYAEELHRQGVIEHYAEYDLHGFSFACSEIALAAMKAFDEETEPDVFSGWDAAYETMERMLKADFPKGGNECIL